MASPEAAAILRELQQQCDNGVRPLARHPSDRAARRHRDERRDRARRSRAPRAAVDRALLLTSIPRASSRLSRFTALTVPTPSLFAVADVRRLQHQEPAVGIRVLRHLHVPRVFRDPPRTRRPRQLRQVRDRTSPRANVASRSPSSSPSDASRPSFVLVQLVGPSIPRLTER